ncbi:signal peptide peptidase SppA [Candidatus Blochmanniella camponoti]|uniref:Signal peptide peptidase SppA n=1 Tax=Candidatus Blochmanniella camponoti TaxID=108080 RepID=A0ABY4SV55_9ENTR|nr:signal peptide peptidase SppA [Candidatus Blochmannia herculeanus]URJ24820.1 signal peptide peptidase SppA [Candidatus Blochmannia herculeanus]
MIKSFIQNIWKIIYKILRYSVRTLYLIRTVIINIFFIIFIMISVGVYLNLRDSSASLSKYSALILDLSGIIVDKPVTYSKFQKFSQHLLNTNRSNAKENSLFDIINILRQAKNDPHITGLILSLKNFYGSNQTSLEYIGKALREFKESGKPIYAISDYYNQSQYLLASYANKIYLTPHGFVDLRGISTSKLYYKSLLDNLKVNTHIFRVGAYKSAVEPFIQDHMSDHVRHEETKLVNRLWDQYLKIISINRNTTTQAIFPGINNILNELHQMQGDTAAYALKNKWIDEIASHFVIENTMKEIFGSNKQGTSFNAISMYDYNLIAPTKQDNQIAIICINGPIVDGPDIPGSIGGDTIAHKIRSARFDPKIKAIVLRVNSPGGSVNASELIRLELIAVRDSGKPVVVSMGGIAASGGYWISTPANVIIASNSTITGSIGIFGIINTFEKSLDTIGIHSDGVNTSPISNISITTPLPTEYINMMQLYVNTSYHYFINTVAESRCKTAEDIHKIAQGHVWLGYDAIKNGLIDNIGDLDDAINKAIELAHLKEYQLNWYENKINWIDVLMQQANKVIHNIIVNLLNHYVSLINVNNNIKINNSNILQFSWNDPKHCYALDLDYSEQL